MREEKITPRIGSSGARTRWLKTESEAAVGEAEMLSLEAIGSRTGMKCLARVLSLRSQGEE